MLSTYFPPRSVHGSHSLEETHKQMQGLGCWIKRVIIQKHPLAKTPLSQATIRSTKTNFLGPGDCRVGLGSSTRRGRGRKVRALPWKFVSLWFRGREPGMSREFYRDVPDPWGVQKVSAQKKACAHVWFPIETC